jgi:hypothetical protein
VTLAAALESPRQRLALPRLPGESDFNDGDALALRADATRRWIAGQAMAIEVILAATRACDVAADRESVALADAIDVLRDAADTVLNNSARAELTTLAQMLRRSSLAAMR